MIRAAQIDIEPIGDRVVVKRNIAIGQTAGGLALPDSAKESPRIGTVVAVGPGALRLFSNELAPDGTEDRFPMQCEVGD